LSSRGESRDLSRGQISGTGKVVDSFWGGRGDQQLAFSCKILEGFI
jgi:hypothetical protein